MHLRSRTSLVIQPVYKPLLFAVALSLVIGSGDYVLGQDVHQDTQTRIIQNATAHTALQIERFQDEQVAQSNKAACTAKQIHGMIGEDFVDNYYRRGGWTKLNSKIGPQGIDGLFIKTKNGVVEKVLVVESKFGNSRLSPKQKQMSHKWISNNTDRAISKLKKEIAQCTDPQKLKVLEAELNKFRQIKRHIQRKNYRPRLSRVTIKDSVLTIQNYELNKDGIVRPGEPKAKPTKIDLSDPPRKGKKATFYKDYFDSIQKELEKQLVKQGLDPKTAKATAKGITAELKEEWKNKTITNNSDQYHSLIKKVLQAKIDNAPNPVMKNL